MSSDENLRKAYSRLDDDARRVIVTTLSDHAPKLLNGWMQSARVSGGFRASTARKWINDQILKQLARELLQLGNVVNLHNVLIAFCRFYQPLYSHMVHLADEDGELEMEDVRERLRSEVGGDPLYELFDVLLLDLIANHRQYSTADTPDEGYGTITGSQLSSLDELAGPLRDAVDMLGTANEVDRQPVELLLRQLFDTASALRESISTECRALNIEMPSWESREGLESVLEDLASRREAQDSVEQHRLVADLAHYLESASIAHRSNRIQERLKDVLNNAVVELSSAQTSEVLPGPQEPVAWLGWAMELEDKELDELVDTLDARFPNLGRLIDECEVEWILSGGQEVIPTPQPRLHDKPEIEREREGAETEHIQSEEQREADSAPPKQFTEDDDAERTEIAAIEEGVAQSLSIADQSQCSDSSPADTVDSEELANADSLPVDVGLTDAANSAIDIAALLRSDQRPELWNRFMSQLLVENDIAAAYWVARSLEHDGHAPAAPVWLMAAAYGSSVIGTGTDSLVAGIAELAESGQSRSKTDEIIAAAAALPVCLLAPNAGLLSWLDQKHWHDGATRLLGAVREFSTYGIPLQSMETGASAGSSESFVTEIVSEIESWLESAPVKGFKMRRAAQVWRKLVMDGGEVHSLLSSALVEKASSREAIRDAVKQLGKRAYVNHLIDNIDRKSVHGKHHKLIASPRVQILRGIDEALSLAGRWLEASDAAYHQQDKPDDWLAERQQQLHRDVEDSVESAMNCALAIREELDDPALQGAGAFLVRAIVSTSQLVGIETSPEVYGGNPRLVEQKSLGQPAGLQERLNSTLIWLPRVALDEELSPKEGALGSLRTHVAEAFENLREIDDVYQEIMESHDYRRANSVLAFVDNEGAIESMRENLQTSIRGSRVALKKNLGETRTKIETALIDGVVSDQQRAQLVSEVEQIEVYDGLDYQTQGERLQHIQSQLISRQQDVSRRLETSWNNLKDKSGDSAVAIDADAVRLIEEALSNGDVRVAEELLSQVEQAVARGESAAPLLPSATEENAQLEAFLESIEGVKQWLSAKQGMRRLMTAIQKGDSISTLNYGQLSPARLQEVRRSLKAWRDVKGRGPRNLDIQQPVLEILGFLGLTPTTTSEEEAIERLARGSDVVHLRARMSCRNLARPISKFGSQCIGDYHIVCLWERPGADKIGARLADLGVEQSSVIVMNFGTLTSKQRQMLSRRARRDGLAAIVLDECLLAFLCVLSDARFPSLLGCALPFASVNPYAPFRAGDVPPEIFYGRDQMSRDLIGTDTCVVFGGRQLGKSALLRHVRRSFHEPDLEHYAYVIDIKLIGTAEDPPATLWSEIRKALVELGLLSGRVRTNRPDGLSTHIEQTLAAAPERRILLLLDEADNFLEADSKNRFEVVESLRTLMLSTGRRLRVVFAGLHGVQRFQGIANQPLAHFGMPLRVGPLEAAAAKALVEQPLHKIGFRFASEGVILSVLSYTNYHPGLVQLFCHELVKRLQRTLEEGGPPHTIRQNDVEAVYLDVRDQIRERLELTLRLDKRYQAIAWSMILDQMESEGSYAGSYSPGALLSLSKENWPKGFDSTQTDEMRSLLDEMCGLGFLVHDEKGHFRLRSPNLVSLMGDTDEVFGRLSELSSEEVSQRFVADSHHARLDSQGTSYSPLTFAQERALLQRKFGYCMVFGTDAAMCARVAGSLDRIAEAADRDDSHSVSVEIPDGAVRDGQLDEWLRDFLSQHKDEEQLFALSRYRGDGATLRRACEQADRVIRRNQGNKTRWLRIIFLFDPESCWEWTSLEEEVRRSIEERADAVATIRPWDSDGLQLRLIQAEKFDTEEVVKTVLTDTGGWPLLLDRLFEECADVDDPRIASASIAVRLAEDGSAIRRDYRMALGLNRVRSVRVLLEKVVESAGLPVDMIRPDFIEENLTSQQCERALDVLLLCGIVTLQENMVVADKAITRVIGPPKGG